MDSLDGRFIIDNKRNDSKDAVTVENPATLEPLGAACMAPADECRRAVEAAKAAFPRWRDIPPREKRRIFLNAREILLGRSAQIAELITREKGTPLVESLSIEVFTVLEALEYYGRNQMKTMAPRKVSPHVPLFAHKKCRYQFEPLGPSLIISPWNFPFLLPFLDIISELTAGNTIIFRPSTSTPFTGLAVAEIMMEAGLPAGVLNTVPCRVAQAEEIIVNPIVRSVNFTGSVPVGKRIMELASRNLTKVILELGGKDPMIVLQDADLELAARGAVSQAFMNTGQSCASVERVYVDAAVAGAFKRRTVEIAASLRVGDPLDAEVDIGPMENSDQVKVVADHVREAKDKGAEVLYGGEKISPLPGYFYAPTVLAGVNHTMKIMTEETFGPVLPIMEFSDVEEAIALANDSRYGLSASVWTRDKKLAARLAARLEAGSVTVNDHMMTFSEPEAIWGGVKQTGHGRTHGPYGILELANIKFVCADYSRKHTKMWWYPYGKEDLRLMDKALGLLHGRKLGWRIRSLASLLPQMGAVFSTTPFRSLVKIASRLFRG